MLSGCIFTPSPKINDLEESYDLDFRILLALILSFAFVFQVFQSTHLWSLALHHHQIDIANFLFISAQDSRKIMRSSTKVD